ncbi:GMC family oxidoreductase [Methylococcus sp. EFPC2]|nr:GMC family oxidoreductase [Methylococcus sp. EFPC2]
MPAADTEFDYIVVGSGAGGGPLAANLARRGHKVLLVEAGDDDEGPNYQIPLFHPLASEDPQMRWDFFVRHFQDETRSRKDSKFRPDQDGVLYPRSSTLGGCTAHNAMILVYPHNDDWDYIAELTGDPSWRADSMRAYFERLENCQYASSHGDNRARHGFSGWLPISLPSLDTVLAVLRDREMRDVLLGSVLTALQLHLGKPLDLLKSRFDPNDWRSVVARSEGLCKVPLTTHKGRRAGPRDYIRDVQRSCGSRLTVKLNTLVTKVILEDVRPADGPSVRKMAVGIEYLHGKRLYRADRQAAGEAPATAGSARARREVILAGGAFNTPQLLMLSGIGPERHLQNLGIPVQVDLPGVGENLQDRYEIAVVTEMKNEFPMLRGLDFKVPQPGEPDNPFYREWLEGEGIFTTNGAVIAFTKKSTAEQANPDLFIFGMPGSFAGYFPDYSRLVAADQKHFTWAILKAHTNNTAGVVRLKSTDPRERPYINFRYFDEGNDHAGEDLQALVHGLQFVRAITRSERMSEHIAAEVVPGPTVNSPEQLAEFAKFNAWGHHASCSCRMGAEDDPLAVVDSRFRVRQVDHLRIVDASVFPRIPGFFIVSAVYMISEKAAEVIDRDARAASRSTVTA